MSGKAYEPALFVPGKVNAAGEQTLKATLVFGSSVLSKTLGNNVAGKRNSAGNFTLSLPRTYRRRTKVVYSWGVYPAGAVFFPVTTADNVATADANGQGGITFETRTEAGVATDPPTGAQLDIEITVSNDTLNDKAYT